MPKVGHGQVGVCLNSPQEFSFAVSPIVIVVLQKKAQRNV